MQHTPSYESEIALPHELNHLASLGDLAGAYSDLNGLDLPADTTLSIDALGATDFSRAESYRFEGSAPGEETEINGVPLLRIDSGQGTFTDVMDISQHPQRMDDRAEVNYATVTWVLDERNGWQRTGFSVLSPSDETEKPYGLAISQDGQLTVKNEQPAKISLLGRPQAYVQREALRTSQVTTEDAVEQVSGKPELSSVIQRTFGATALAQTAETVSLPEEGGDRRAREVLHGITPEAAVFETAMLEKLTAQPVEPFTNYHKFDLNSARRSLEQHGITIDPLAAPDAIALGYLQPEDFAAVRESPTPLQTLWSKAYHDAIESRFKAVGLKDIEGTPSFRQQQELFRSLPLTHTTTVASLESALETGSFRSNRQLADEGKDTTVGTGIGQTNVHDREVGLDGYVFADFGRPASNRRAGEVSVVLEPEAMLQPGAFLTEHDLQDCMTSEGDISYRSYMKGSVSPDDFYDVGLKRILATTSTRSYYAGQGLGNSYHGMTLHEFIAGADSDPDQSGRPQFSTWEAKIPEVSTQHIRKVVFADPDQYRSFKELHGDQIPCELAEPQTLEGGTHAKDVGKKYEENLELYGTTERYQKNRSG